MQHHRSHHHPSPHHPPPSSHSSARPQLLEKHVLALKGAVRLAKVNIDALPQLAEQFGVKQLPTVLALHDRSRVGACLIAAFATAFILECCTRAQACVSLPLPQACVPPQKDGRLLRWRSRQRQDSGPPSAIPLSRHHSTIPLVSRTPHFIARHPTRLTHHLSPHSARQAFVRKVAAAAGPLPSDMLLSDADALVASGDLSAASAALQVQHHTRGRTSINFESRVLRRS